MTTYEQSASELARLVELTEQQRQAYPTIIFEQASEGAEDRTAIEIAIQAAKEVGLQVVGDITQDSETGTTHAVIRTATVDRFGAKPESAFMLGTVLTAERSLHGQTPTSALTETRAAAQQIAGDPVLADAFKQFYGAGMRLSRDENSLVEALFISSVKLELDSLDKVLTPDLLTKVNYAIKSEELQVDYSARKQWDGLAVTDILQKHPQLDYRRLNDKAFAASADGQELASAYRSMLGQELAAPHKRDSFSFGPGVNPNSLIPLSHVPILENLMIAEVNASRPRAKYDFSDNDPTGYVLNSDSLRARQAFTDSMCRRLPHELRHVFDGPDELQHKNRRIHELSARFKSADPGEYRDQLRQNLLQIFSTYTGDGEIASGVRLGNDEYQERVSGGISRDGRQLTEVVKGIISTVLPTPEAADFLSSYTATAELTVGKDSISLSRAEHLSAMLDAFRDISKTTDPVQFERFARMVFGDLGKARQLRASVEAEMQADELSLQPHVVAARLAMSKTIRLGSDRSKEEQAAHEAWEEAMLPANKCHETSRKLLNDLFFETMQEFADAELLGDQQYHDIVEAMIKKMSFGETRNLTRLPADYDRLLAIGKHPNMPGKLRTTIAYALKEKIYGWDDDTKHLLSDIVLDIHELILGQPNNLLPITYESDFGLSPAEAIMREGGFHVTDANQLAKLQAYRAAVQELYARVATRQLGGSDSTENLNYMGGEDDIVRNIERVRDSLDSIEQYYRKYLHILDVVEFPHVYYPWIMEKVMPFYQKMQWEVGPGNRPTQAVSELFGTLQQFVEQDFLKRDVYDEDFDVLGAGKFGRFMQDLHRQMVLDRNISYNGTVWREGNTFLHYAVAYMPPKLLKQFQHEYASNEQFVDYLTSARAHQNK